MTVITPRKRFGQHFLHDGHVIEQLIQAIRPTPEQTIVEIGPGLGALTQPLLAACKQLTVIELDRDVIPVLQRNCSHLGELTVHQADVLNVALATLPLQKPLRLVGNLPYNISTPLLFHLLKQKQQIIDMHFMLQKEVAQRLAASAGTSAYGRLSVMVQYHCEVTTLFDIGPGAFQPPPKIDSSFVRLLPHRQAPVQIDDEADFAQLVSQAFGQRRKTLRNSLKKLVPATIISAADVDPGLRPEQLVLADFAKLSNRYTALKHSAKTDSNSDLN